MAVRYLLGPRFCALLLLLLASGQFRVVAGVTDTRPARRTRRGGPARCATQPSTTQMPLLFEFKNIFFSFCLVCVLSHARTRRRVGSLVLHAVVVVICAAIAKARVAAAAAGLRRKHVVHALLPLLRAACRTSSAVSRTRPAKRPRASSAASPS